MKIVQILHHSISPFIELLPGMDALHYNSGWPMLFARAIRAHDPGIEAECWRPERTLRRPYVWKDDENVVHRVFPSLYARYGYELSPSMLRAARLAVRSPGTCFIVHGSYNPLAYLLGPILARAPAILQSHGGFPAPVQFRINRHRWLRWVYLFLAPWERRALPRYPHIFAISSEERGYLERLVPGSRVSFSPVGMDFDLFSPGERPSARRACGIPEDARVVLYVGRLSVEKGIESLIEAFDAVARSVGNARLFIVGTGPLERALRSRVDRPGLRDRVSFAGFVPNAELPKWYRAADVTVMPSDLEWFGAVGAESMACGTPLVTTQAGGAVDIVREFECGVLVPPRDAARLAEGILAVLSGSVNTTPNIGRARASFSWPHKLAHALSLFEAMAN